MTLQFEARKRFGAFSFDAALEAEQEIVVLFGHSGAGKSLSLQFIAGLAQPEAGRIAIGGALVFDSAAGVNLPPQARDVGYVVQDLALFGHMTVAENVAFGIPRARDRSRRVSELLELLQLQGFEQRRPGTLSGGQQQRVALARALAREGRLLLLDEPFSALDESLRAGLRRELIRLRAELGLTIIFVTHDLREAHLLGDRLAVFDDGRILQFGPREDVFRRPVSRRVGELTGVANIFPACAMRAAGPLLRTRSADGLELLATRLNGCELPGGSAVELMIRAERVNLRREPPPELPNVFEAVIAEEFAYGNAHTLHFVPVGPGPRLEVEIASRPYDVLGVSERKRWYLEIPPEDLLAVPAS
ncbi:MAG: ABC transporter ATP-binding protein [Dehalococcoidia bacterium]|nr:ABC transporter ATP-binding protein [Dehalococcoidia bacterium]